MTRPPPLRLVVLGTGTEVGKTYVSALLLRALRASGQRVLGLKPVETGLRAARGAPPEGSDAWTLETSAGFAPRPHPLFGYPRPVSPHLEARRRGRPVACSRIAAWVTAQETHLAQSDDHAVASHVLSCTLIETAGAALSPLGPRTTNVDLARAVGPATWILVAPDSLGVLHDVRATWTALAALGRAPDHLILTASREPDASTGTNARELPRVGLPRPAAFVARHAADPDLLRPLVRRLLAGRRSP